LFVKQGFRPHLNPLPSRERRDLFADPNCHCESRCNRDVAISFAKLQIPKSKLQIIPNIKFKILKVLSIGTWCFAIV
jgi:hypothetical protein